MVWIRYAFTQVALHCGGYNVVDGNFVVASGTSRNMSIMLVAFPFVPHLPQLLVRHADTSVALPFRMFGVPAALMFEYGVVG